MNSGTAFVLATFVAQTIAVLCLAVVFQYFHGVYRRSYLQHWSRCWWALLAYLTGSTLSFYFLGIHLSGSWMRQISSSISLAAAYPHIAWLLFGTWELASGQTVARRTSRMVIPIAMLFGVVCSLLFLGVPGPSSERLFVRFGIRALITGSAFVAAGVTVWRIRWQGPGPKIVGTAFTIYGLELLHVFIIDVNLVFWGSNVAYAPYLGLVDLLSLAIIGLGMVIWLLDEERVRASGATLQIEHLAYHDALTGLANRSLFLDHLNLTIAQADRAHSRLGVAYVDLDRFKIINDSLGHTTGDELLRAVASRLRGATRETDTVARLGGDEFTVLLPSVDEGRAVNAVGRKLLGAFSTPFNVHDQELYVSASIGISLYPRDGDDAETLLKHADLAMYQAKELGRNNVQLFARALGTASQRQLTLEKSVRRAIAEGELTIFYQPIVDVQTTVITGAECLVRWQHPERGLLMPGDFLSAVERVGASSKLDWWVLSTACVQARRWVERFHSEFKIAVNLSARAFQEPDLAARIGRLLEDAGLAPCHLAVEITETIAMGNIDISRRTIQELSASGIQVAIDDFGTGYSSMSYLRQFPVHAIKIDRNFLRGIPGDRANTAITSAQVSLAKNLGLRVIAEGVETRQQHEFLQRIGCDEAQGYYFHQPLWEPNFEEILIEYAAMRELEKATIVANQTPDLLN